VAVKKRWAHPADIRAIRKRAKLTRADAAARVGVSARTWQAWELGERNMRRFLYDVFINRS
jgi:DNA-binding transcriptional regulator YiaG